jgi:hypothetical protein
MRIIMPVPGNFKEKQWKAKATHPSLKIICATVLVGGWLLRLSDSVAATGPVSRSSDQPPFTGVYSLQALIDFDVLDGVAFDPSAGTLALFGHQSGREHPLHIAYLDHLATALESKSPTFSLEWTKASERDVDRALEISDKDLVEKLSNYFDDKGHLTSLGAWFLRQGGAEVTEGMERSQAVGKILRATGRTQAGQVMELVGQALRAQNMHQDASDYLMKIYKALGVFEPVRDLSVKYNAGSITKEQLFDQSIPLFLDALATTFEWEQNRYTDRYLELRGQGKSCEEGLEGAFDYFDRPADRKVIMRRAIDAMFENISEIHVPPFEVRSILGVEPQVYPVYEGLAAHSLLARVAFEADVFCKSLMNMPDAAEKVPGYRTYFQWRRTKSRTPATDGRTWISPGSFELTESQDGNTIQFVRSSMQFHMEKYSAGKSVSDPMLNEYADELTALYDDLAKAYPILDEMRECEKILVVAGWLKKRGFNIAFPAAGRSYWNPPAVYPGIIHMAIAIKSGPVGAVLTAAGGVDMRVDKWWTLRKGSTEIPVVNTIVPSLKQPNDQLNQIYRTLKIVEPPNPARDLPGWVVQARGGEKAASYVALRQAELGRQSNAAEAQLLLERMRTNAEQMIFYDRILNSRTKDRIQGLEDMKTLQREVDKNQEEILKESLELALGMSLKLDQLKWEMKWGEQGINTAERIRGKKFLERTEHVSQWRELTKLVSEELNEEKAGKYDQDRIESISKQLADVVIEVKKQMDLTDINNYWLIADEATARTSLMVAIPYGLFRLGTKVSHHFELRKVNAKIADSMGDSAMDLAEVERDRKTCVDDYYRDKKQLEALSH